MNTELCQKLGLRYPILQAAIGGISCPKLAAAVSEAGGLGSVAMTGWGYTGTKSRLQQSRALTDRGIVANLLLSYEIDAEFDAILEDPPKAVSFFWGDASPFVERVHRCGSLVMVSVGSVDEARRAADSGADIIVAQGWEAGGHVRGEISTLALVPAVVDAIDPIPVVAAGGISDGRGLAAVLCLGAQAAWVGTRFLAAEEADIHPIYQDRVLSADTSDTYYSKLFDGGWPDAPGRVLRNETILSWENAGKPPSGQRPNEGEVIARHDDGSAITRYEANAMRSTITGNVEAAPLWAGQGVGLVNRREGAAEIVIGMANEAHAVLTRR